MRVNTIRLRAMLGWLSILLPWIVALLVGHIPSSISATYHTNAATSFMIILGASSILLMSYKGYDRLDDILLTLAGCFGLIICLFPTGAEAKTFYIGTFLLDIYTSTIIHNIAAVIFFALLAYNSFFLFTKGDKNPTKNKKIRNIIYRICALGMLGSFSLMLLPRFEIQIWLVETIALFFFGLSFLTKADIYPWLFCDSPYSD